MEEREVIVLAQSKRAYYTFDGLDAVGKSELIGRLVGGFGAVEVKTPDMLVSPWRSFFDRQPLPLRYAYYCLGNCLANRRVQGKLDAGFVVVQDRSWLTTQAAHELRDLSPAWLSVGERLAKHGLPPDLAIIIEVKEAERKRRLEGRGYLRRSDRENLAFAGRMNGMYYTWAEKLGWQSVTFDNTKFEPETAVQELANLLNLGGM